MSKINLIIEPQTTKKWKDFFKSAPQYSVAIDGYVADSTKFFPTLSIANFNHHEFVDRLSTRSTCAQILMAIRMGFFDNYKDKNGEIIMNIFTNDCDEDVCLSYYLLKHGYRSKNTIDPSLNRLVSMIDMLDTTAGTYPFPSDLPALKELAWVFQPYRIARVNGVLGTKNLDVYRDIITNVERRITDHICNKGEQIDIDTSYELISRNKHYSLVKETGAYSRLGMLSDGIKAFVSIRERQNGVWDYSIGKMSPFVSNFNLNEIFKELNKIENNPSESWGGADTIGGSPRYSGSKLNPQEIEEIINNVIDENY